MSEDKVIKFFNSLNSLKEKGYIEKEKELAQEETSIYTEAEEIAKNLIFEDKMEICACCVNHDTCIELHNSKCPILIKNIEEFLKIGKREETKKNEQEQINMDEMQRNILVALLNARKECTEENLLTARGCVAIIDALFYLVNEIKDIICCITDAYCTECKPGLCENKEVNNGKNK
ncbi:MAG: hypothetical protein K2N51_07760 [Lachnospiraceae bacterium]|nr:hypothetical protein [Lachnospiraceae bacterium]